MTIQSMNKSPASSTFEIVRVRTIDFQKTNKHQVIRYIKTSDLF